MESKKFDAVQLVRSIRDSNYEETKGLTRKELLKWYKERGRAAKKQFRENTKDSHAPN